MIGVPEDPSPEPGENGPPDAEDAPAPAEKKRRRGRWLPHLLLLIVAGGGIAAWGAYQWALGVHRGPGPLATETELAIPSGTGLRAIADRLSDAGVIAEPEIFVLMARLNESHTKLKAGEYRFAPGISQVAVLDKLIRNEVIERSVTIPEGLTSREVLALIVEAEGVEGDFGSPPPEGSLLPETYHYRRGVTVSEMVQRMRRAMDDALSESWAARAEGLPFDTPEEALTLASIVEKETGVDSERARVAAVFVNRLRKGMRLQSDPTVIFALTEGEVPLGRALTRQDWKVDHPYNTYVIGGLPPGPIANPGLDALKAVMDPLTTNELYFVANGTGGHSFAETLKEHNRNVAKWRKFKRSQQNQ